MLLSMESISARGVLVSIHVEIKSVQCFLSFEAFVSMEQFMSLQTVVTEISLIKAASMRG